jgi:hypothetical protein
MTFCSAWILPPVLDTRSPDDIVGYDENGIAAHNGTAAARASDHL